MAEDKPTYPTPLKPHQSPAPAKEASLPRIGGPSPRDSEPSLPRLTTRPDGTVTITKGGSGRE